jgi:glucokinase
VSVLAVDLGGTKTTVAVVSAEGVLGARRKLPAVHTLSESVDQIAAAVTADVSAVGVIVPGIYTPSTGTAWCPNLWGRDEVPLLEALTARIRAPVVIDSDRSGYVLGEAWLGAARGLDDVVFLSISTGIGAGILSRGEILRGAHGIAGAVGWFALDSEWTAHYGWTGCWEANAGGPAIAGLFGVADARVVVDAARDGDIAARSVLEHAARYTGMGIANLISLLNPEVVVLGGGVMHGAADLLLEPIRTEVRRWAQPIAASRCRIELSQLGEDAGLFGAARLALTLS